MKNTSITKMTLFTPLNLDQRISNREFLASFSVNNNDNYLKDLNPLLTLKAVLISSVLTVFNTGDFRKKYGWSGELLGAYYTIFCQFETSIDNTFEIEPFIVRGRELDWIDNIKNDKLTDQEWDKNYLDPCIWNYKLGSINSMSESAQELAEGWRDFSDFPVQRVLLKIVEMK